MVPGPDGRFYGSTISGGSSAQPNSAVGDGTVFAITAAGEFTKIADVPPEPSSVVATGRVGTYGVIAPLTFGQDGAIYGTRKASIFRLSVTGNFVTIKPLPPGFGHTERAYDPTIVAGSDGYFYGPTPPEFSWARAASFEWIRMER
jgi:uncharacterized repeat protein (TIGR03803 family)